MPVWKWSFILYLALLEARALHRALMISSYRIVICLTISAFPEDALLAELAPAFFSNTFQNFKLSSAAEEMLARTIT
jgi:hypothetical protein